MCFPAVFLAYMIYQTVVSSASKCNESKKLSHSDARTYYDNTITFSGYNRTFGITFLACGSSS
jgi:hypothetical protein